ncbi:MAG: UDP-N-acetylglucosamine 1-carboxyvinyltransferase [Alphaproteobacteria bacterium]
MDKIRIQGGKILEGSVQIGGAKNAALPLMVASLLTEDSLVLSNIPHLADIVTMANLLMQHGVTLDIDGTSLTDEIVSRVILLNGNNITNRVAPYEIVRKMRASVWVLGPLLARFGEASVSLPGGCAIGMRPIDMHLAAFEAMGAVTNLKDGYIHATTNGKKLKGADIHFNKVSVGATINTLMAATLAEGKTTLYNAAMEPEISDLARCLQAMGANIEGIGTNTLIIDGVNKLHGAHHKIIPDRIEAGTYAIAASITGGDIELLNITYDSTDSFIEKLLLTGTEIIPTEKGIRVRRKTNHIKSIDIITQPYPGFATDMQAQFMALMAVADGSSIISETIFENRFMHVPEVNRMGANISINGNTAIVRGVERLKGAEVMATDLRASVSLVLAALVAEGETIINRVYHIDRGYERIEEKLASCGALIERIK